MKELVTHSKIMEIDIDLDVDIYILNTRIFTTSKLSKIYNLEKEIKKTKYLCMNIEFQLDDYESVVDGAVFARPRFLILLGILTFITQTLFTPFEFLMSSTIVGKFSYPKFKKLKFKFNKINYEKDLNTIVEFLDSESENEKRLFYSLIDRYRKAIFLEKESEERMTHDDEILLSYYHIIELLSTKYSNNQKQFAKKLIDNFSEKILKDIYFLEGNQLKSDFIKKSKIIQSMYMSEIPISSKIMYMFHEQGILTHRLKSFIAELINDRNSVAHGRQVYQEKVIFPVPPFFPLIKDMSYTFEMLRTLSGRAISIFLGIDHLEQEFIDFEENLIPSIDELNAFINEKKFEKITIDEFYNGSDNNITPQVVTYYIIKKRLKIKKAIPVLSNVIINYREVEDEIFQIILAVILIVDETIGLLREKCIEIIKLSSNNEWYPNFKLRDVLYELEYLGYEPKIFKDMLIANEIK